MPDVSNGTALFDVLACAGPECNESAVAAAVAPAAQGNPLFKVELTNDNHLFSDKLPVYVN
jgi:hypothetical protein